MRLSSTGLRVTLAHQVSPELQFFSHTTELRHFKQKNTLPAAHWTHLKVLIVDCTLAESKKSALKKFYGFCVYVLGFMKLAGHREPLGWMND